MCGEFLSPNSFLSAMQTSFPRIYLVTFWHDQFLQELHNQGIIFPPVLTTWPPTKQLNAPFLVVCIYRL